MINDDRSDRTPARRGHALWRSLLAAALLAQPVASSQSTVPADRPAVSIGRGAVGGLVYT